MGRELAIALITYRRTSYAVQTIRALSRNLRFDGRVGLYIADDGSEDPGHVRMIRQAVDTDVMEIIGVHSQRLYPGTNQNWAAEACFTWADQVLWLEDDWELTRPFDVTPYYDDLADDESIGMVRMGYLSRDLDCHIDGIRDRRLYLRMLRSSQYAFAGHPAIRHSRWWQNYGPYPNDRRSAGECELAMCASYRSHAGPDVVWPLELPPGGYFGHIGTEKA